MAADLPKGGGLTLKSDLLDIRLAIEFLEKKRLKRRCLKFIQERNMGE
jgi:hypothetical protein